METLTLKTKRVTTDERKVNLPFCGRKPDGTLYRVNHDGIIVAVRFEREVANKYVSIRNYYAPEAVIDETDEEVTDSVYYEAYEKAIFLLHEQANSNL